MLKETQTEQAKYIISLEEQLVKKRAKLVNYFKLMISYSFFIFVSL